MPRTPELGVIEASVGVPGVTTVNVTGLLTPPAVLTVTFLAVNEAVAEIANVAVIVVSFTTVKPLTVMPLTPPPPPLDTLIPVEPVKPVPFRVTGTLVPLAPVVGEIEARAPGGTIIVNATVLLVPAVAVVTLTFLTPPDVKGEIVNVAVTVVSVPFEKPETVIPPPPVTLMAVAPVKPVPVRVTPKLVPRLPEAGVIEERTGPVTVNGTVLVSTPAFVT